jgi:hypothetical protein
MSRPRHPFRHVRHLPFGIAADWTPQQACAVVELLDELRELIYSHYLHQIQDQMRADRQSSKVNPNDGDPPF